MKTRPCPFCGGVSISRHGTGHRGFLVCNECKARGPEVIEPCSQRQLEFAWSGFRFSNIKCSKCSCVIELTPFAIWKHSTAAGRQCDGNSFELV